MDHIVYRKVKYYKCCSILQIFIRCARVYIPEMWADVNKWDINNDCTDMLKALFRIILVQFFTL